VTIQEYKNLLIKKVQENYQAHQILPCKVNVCFGLIQIKILQQKLKKCLLIPMIDDDFEDYR